MLSPAARLSKRQNENFMQQIEEHMDRADKAEKGLAEVAKSNSEKGYGRLYAVWWSHHNPNLLDARISSIGSNSNKQLLFQQNATNGMSDCCLPLRRIPQKEYYNDYQVALGTDLHAAFRPLGSARRGGSLAWTC